MLRTRVPHPWQESSLHQLPMRGAVAEELAFLVRYAILAPSCHNTQPWRFKLADEHIWLYADRSRQLSFIDPQARQLYMSCAAALLNIRVAARALLGHTSHVYLFPTADEPDLLARLSLGLSVNATRGDHDLAEAIVQRRTNRRPFYERSVGHTAMAEIMSAVEEEGAWVARVSHSHQVEVASLVARADEILFSDRSYRRELSAWLTYELSGRVDGVPIRSLGKGLFETLPFLVHQIDLGIIESTKHRNLAEKSPLLLVIGTSEDRPRDWVRAGQAMQRALLVAQRHGISASFLNRMIETDHLRAQLTDIIQRPGHPQLVLRMGYGPSVPATPRRPLHEVFDQP